MKKKSIFFILTYFPSEGAKVFTLLSQTAPSTETLTPAQVLTAPQSMAVDGSLVRVKGFLNDGRLSPG